MIVSKARYDAVSKGAPLIQRRMSKRVIREGAIRILNTRTGEIQEREDFETRSGCPVKDGAVTHLRYKDKHGNTKGKLFVKVTAIDYSAELDRWLIRWERVTKHNPAPADERGVYMAPVTGYTSASKSIDPDAPVIPDEHVEQFMADDLAAKREARRLRLQKIDEDADALTESPAERKAQLKIKQAIAAALAELTDDEKAA